MISPSFVELHRLQREAVALCQTIGCPVDLLTRADCVEDVRREAGKLIFALATTQSVALRVVPDVFGRVHDAALPAVVVLAELFNATTDELHAGLEVEAARG